MIDIFNHNLDAVICIEIICGIIVYLKIRYTISFNNSLFINEQSTDVYNKYGFNKDDIVEDIDTKYVLFLLNMVLIITLLLSISNIVIGLSLSILLIILEVISYKYILSRIKSSGKRLYVIKKELFTYRSGEGYIEDYEYILKNDTGILQKLLSMSVVSDMVMIISYLYSSIQMILIFI